ncbi:DNA-methyltransferase [Micromonospora sp. NBC_01796]|uniref:DNA-methyltransferase n=1 Tax=Micromonospora sp. NBC_01796 TaxID=2975987 RepID=UPI002DDBD2B2|nr:site-specific DNA-methyltransferase [Micromonospora sp. NBC_01796]WSA86715.1 site-specific DNA-methyltransferase [Micromonospora sp. NBC_01796]
MPDGSIDTCITSPPYWNLRDYGHPEQLGLEPDVDAWVRNLLSICREIARVLRPGGSLWLNVADSYSIHHRQGAPKKGLLLAPQRLALALLGDGWLVRNQVIWSKTNPMPSSVGDRLSCTYEVMFLLVRSPHYFFDLDAIRQPLTTTAKTRPNAAVYRYLPDDAIPPDVGFDDDQGLNRLKAEGRAGHPLGKNPGDVWSLPTAGYRGAHFATFPLALAERPLLATCPEKVCAACDTPWTRERVDRSLATPALGILRPDCECNTDSRPGVVLDPFMGAGTVAIAAEQYGRSWIGIELNPTFAALARERLAAWRERQHP